MSDKVLTPQGASTDVNVVSSPKTDDAEEREVQALMASFDSRLTEAERRVDRVLARLGVE